MDEKLLNGYIEQADMVLGEATTVEEKIAAMQIKIQARQARQLTRIADQGEPKIKDGLITHKIYRDTLQDVLFLVRKSEMGVEDRTAFLKRLNETLDKARPVPTPPDAEKTLNNLTKLLNEDDGDEEYLERAMAIVNDWRKKQPTSPDALVEAVKNLLASRDEWVCNQRINNLADKLQAAHEKAVT